MGLYFKEFGIPLLPFLLHLILNLIFSQSTQWWQYVDASTLLLTFSFWALYFNSRAPTSTQIPSDSEIEDDIIALRHIFMTIVFVGFSFYGIVTFCKALGYMGDEVFSKLSWCTVIFCLATMITIFWHRSAIKRIIEA